MYQLLLLLAIFRAYYAHLPGWKNRHWQLITGITCISLAKDCHILPRQYLAIHAKKRDHVIVVARVSFGPLTDPSNVVFCSLVLFCWLRLNLLSRILVFLSLFNFRLKATMTVTFIWSKWIIVLRSITLMRWNHQIRNL